MAVQAGSPGRATAFPPIPLRRKLYGFGSIYGKTIRDSRLAFIIAAGLLGGMALVMGVAVSNIFPTPAARLEVDALFGSVPESMMNLFGNVEAIGSKVGTLGGYVTFKYSAIFALGTAIWSIMALSGTLAGEARRGSLDFVAAAPFGKRRIALEKLAAHLTLLWLAMVVLALMTTFSSNVFGDAALGDQIPLLSSAGFALWVGFIAMFFGGLAFALSPLLGRAGSAGVAGLGMGALWITNGLNVGGPLLILSPFNWTFDHVPLVGVYDWPSLALVGILGVVLRGDRRRALRPPRPGRHGRPLAPAAAGGGPRRPRADGPGVRRPAPPGALVGDRPRPGRDPLRVARRVPGGPDLELVRPHGQLRHDLPRRRLRVDRRVDAVLRGAALHRGRLRGGHVRVQVGVGRGGRPAGDGPQHADGPGPLGRRRRRRRRSSRSS